MSKNIPKPIITIGYSTKKKKSGKLTFEIDGNKLTKLRETIKPRNYETTK